VLNKTSSGFDIKLKLDYYLIRNDPHYYLDIFR